MERSSVRAARPGQPHVRLHEVRMERTQKQCAVWPEAVLCNACLTDSWIWGWVHGANGQLSAIACVASGSRPCLIDVGLCRQGQRCKGWLVLWYSTTIREAQRTRDYSNCWTWHTAAGSQWACGPPLLGPRGGSMRPNKTKRLQPGYALELGSDPFATSWRQNSVFSFFLFWTWHCHTNIVLI